MEENQPAEKAKSEDNESSDKVVAEKDKHEVENPQKENVENEGAENENDVKVSEEIDIYLFSNGQRYSPPRKYHLRADDFELKQWGATLGFLARKQYGSLHSTVELHELDGRKVEDPKKIRDCAVYVAVVPPDPFIYAGYDKYLMKASKSFERRFSKVASGVPGETSSPDDVHNDNTNNLKLSQDFTPAPIHVKDNEFRPTYPSTQKNNEARRSSLKNSNQLMTKIKPVRNQVSQQPNVPRKLNLKSDSVAKKKSVCKKETSRCGATINETPGVPGNVSLINKSIDGGKSPYIPELYVCGHSSSKLNESLPVLAHNSTIINTNKPNLTMNENTPTKITKTSKLINKNTKTKGVSSTVTKFLLVSGMKKNPVDHPYGPIHKTNKPFMHNYPKQSLENEKTVANYKFPLNNKNRISETNNKLSTEAKIQGSLPSQVTIITSTRASMLKTSNLSSKEYTTINKANKHENDIEQLQRSLDSSLDSDDASKHTKTNRPLASAALDGQMSVIEEIPMLKHNDQKPDININHEKKYVLLNNTTSKYDTVIEELKNKYKSLDADKSSKYEYTENSERFSPFPSTSQIEILSTVKPLLLSPLSHHTIIDTIIVKENVSKNTKKSPKSNERELNLNDGDGPVLDNSNNYITNTKNSKPSSPKKEFVLVDPNDISVKTVDTQATKIHSITFFVKNDDVQNIAKLSGAKANPKNVYEPIKLPITNMVKDKDIVHINVFRNSLNESSPTEDNTARMQYNGKQNDEITNIYIKGTFDKNADVKKSNSNGKDRHAPGSSGNIPQKGLEMKTTFINPKWEVKSSTIVHELPSKYLIRDFIEPATIQCVKNGDIVNMKSNIQNKNSEDILKSTQTINIDKSNPVTQSDIDDDDDSKTRNELTRSKSLQSIEEDAPHLCCRKDKVVVYQCACCTQNEAENTKNLAVNSLLPGQGFYVLLPVAMPAQNSIRAPYQTCDKQVQHTESFIKTSLNVSNKETLISLPGDGDKPTGMKLSTMSQKINVDDKIVSDSSTKRQVAITGQEIDHSRLIMMRMDHSQTSSRYNLECKQQQTTTITQDQFTQTDWCDVLLEARADQDGHYTFYLPPLHLIQQYTLR